MKMIPKFNFDDPEKGRRYL